MNLAFLSAFSLFLLAYIGWLVWMRMQWNRSQTSSPIRGADPSISILVPFRNEGKNLPVLVECLMNQEHEFKRVEVLFINDHSEDNGPEFIREISKSKPWIRLIELQDNQGKKAALTRGVNIAQGEYIFTLDADVFVGTHWLKTGVDHFLSGGADVQAMPVFFNDKNDILQGTVNLEFASLIVSGACSIMGDQTLMANGANFAFKKDFFKAVNGYDGNDKIASGDDVFLLFKAKQAGRSITFNKSADAVAFCDGPQSAKSFLDQRVRWASKTSAYQSVYPRGAAWVVLLINLLILAGILCFHSWEFVYLWCLKFIIDVWFLWKPLHHFGQGNLISYAFFLSLSYPFYIFGVFIISLFYKPKWKGRVIVNRN